MMPNNALSSTALPAPFLYPRASIRFAAVAGAVDVHLGGIALGDASHGLAYQLWSCFTDGVNISLQAPNTPAFVYLPSTNAVWVALAFDQSGRPFIAYADKNGNAKYYWFNTVSNSFETDSLSGVVFRVFATLDDQRPALISTSDVLLFYVRGTTLFMRVQRDRFAVEYNLGTVPATLVQVGMNLKYRVQFAFQNVQGSAGGGGLPPAEWNLGIGINEPA